MAGHAKDREVVCTWRYFTRWHRVRAFGSGPLGLVVGQGSEGVEPADGGGGVGVAVVLAEVLDPSGCLEVDAAVSRA